jgi:uncharacterized protein (TIGR00255 family)
MTGFGASRQALKVNDQTIALIYLELRSINSRFVDLIFKCPDETKLAEPQIREQISKRISRGKIECRIHIQRDIEADSQAEIAEGQATQKFYLPAIQELKTYQALVKQHFPLAQEMSVKDVLVWPGVIRQEEIAAEQLQEIVLQTLEQALDSLVQSRQTEGNALKGVIFKCIEKMEAIVTHIELKLPSIIQSYQDKLIEKLLTVLNGVDQQGRNISKEEVVERIKQEVVMYGVRIDVAEEIARLKTHFQAVRTALEKGGPVGKRLDFLMQELQRESNTLGAKSVSQETSDASMELKLLVEQIREQVQNLE